MESAKRLLDQTKLEVAANALRREIDARKHYDAEVLQLEQELLAVFGLVDAGRLRDCWRIRDVPGSRLFAEGHLAQYSALEHAYACFKIELIGGADEELAIVKQFIQ